MDERAPGEHRSREQGQDPTRHADTAPATMPHPGSPILGPGYTYGSVSDKISAIVLTGRTPSPGSSASGCPSPSLCC